ncbi:hypothetical protein [Terriglobus roseus]|uniref:hypothetical protein n=1 Tax=Terriglobus roseus TaxID=392734 RepID=UPI0012F62F1C|nr:hypothetical protein [Terriglobus roseus]
MQAQLVRLGDYGKLLDICQVNQSADLAFVLDEICSRDEPYGNTVDLRVDAVPPNRVELHFADKGEKVNSVELRLELVLAVIGEEIGGLKAFHGCAKRFKGIECRMSVLHRGSQEDVEIASIPHEAMGVYCNASNHCVFNSRCVERGEEC